jgi:hypothetical protein
MKNKNMKYGLVIASILISVLMVSSVSAVPYTQHKTMEDEVSAKIQKIVDSKQFQRLKTTVTPLFNESFNETTKNMIYNNFLNIVTEKLPGIQTAPYFPAFCDFLLVVLEAMFLLLGHGIIGTVSALLVVYLLTFVFSLGVGLATIPYCFIATGGLVILTLGLFLVENSVVYQFGIIGALVVLVCLIPVATVVLLIGTPIFVVINMIKCFEDTIIYTTDIIFP